MNILKILNVVPALNQGGVEMVVLESASYFAQCGHHSMILSAGGRMVNDLPPHITHYLLPIDRKSLSTLLQIPRIVHLIKTVQPDIIHTHSRLPAWLIYWSLKQIPLAQRPIVVSTVHGLHSVSRYSEIILQADAVLAVSQTAKQYLLTHYINKQPKKYAALEVIVTPLGVDLAQYNPIEPADNLELRLRLQQCDPELFKKPLLLLVGRISRLKGHQFLIEVMAQLVAEGFSGNALIVGAIDPKHQRYYLALQRQIRERGLQQQIHFLGACSDMAWLYHQANIVLSLSNKPESYGRVVLESLRCQVPVVGWDIGGVGENLRQYYPSGAVSFGDMLQLKNTIISILANSGEIGDISLSTTHYYEQVLAIYAQLIANRARLNNEK